MSKKRKSRRDERHVTPPTDRWQSVLLAAFVALVVARTLVPDDPGGQQGHGAGLDVLWLVLAAVWLLGRMRRGDLQLRFGWPDGLLLALVGWHTASALVAVQFGSPRPAMNMLWEWVAMGTLFILARQIVGTLAEARAAIVVMLGLASGMSAMAVHQHFLSIPADIAAYNAAKHSTESLYALTGQWLPPDSHARQQFEARLESRLSNATFALSNSLAGFLVPWLIVLAGISLPSRRFAAGALKLSLVALLLIGIWLTGSRSAGVAAIVGFLFLALEFAGTIRLPRAWWLVIASTVVVGAISAEGIVSRTSFGKAALNAAWRSMSYRVEYWRATLPMIRKAPLFGCGPGQFQDNYTAHKLLGAAEEVQDPHNWLLEVWATAGTPAAVLLLSLLGVVAVRTLRARDSSLGAINNSPKAANGEISLRSIPLDAAVAGGVAGIVLGTVLAWLTGFPLARAHVIILVVGLLGALFVGKRWALEGVLPRYLPLTAAMAMLVNLLAAGGIGYPAVADSLWLLLAIECNWHIPCAARLRSSSNGTWSVPAAAVRWTSCLLMAAMLVAAIWIEYRPVMSCRLQGAIADAALAASRADEHRAALEAAAAADPWSAAAAVRLSVERFNDYESLPTDTQLRSFAVADARKLALAPRRSTFWAQSAECAAAIHERTGSVEYLEAAKRYLERAIELYPTNAAFRGQAAKFWQSIGEPEQARAAAAEALRLDDAMRAADHPDRVLPPALRLELESLANSQH